MGGKTYFFMRDVQPEPTMTPGMPDVYWDGKPEHGLPDDPKTGKPMVFSSKAEKAAYLKANGLVEAGDRVNGSKPNIVQQQAQAEAEYHAKSVENDREMARQALAEVRKMGIDYRRQQVLKILKESGRL